MVTTPKNVILINVAKSGVECGVFHTHLQKESKLCRKFRYCAANLKVKIFVGFENCTLIGDAKS